MSAYGDLMLVHGVHVLVEDHDTPKIVPVVDLDSLDSKDSIVPINLGED
jgi:hypothetical protein